MTAATAVLRLACPLVVLATLAVGPLPAAMTTSGSITADGLATVSGGLHRSASFNGVVAAAAAWSGPSVRGVTWNAELSALHLHGSSPSARHIGDSFGASNIDADAGARLFEAWVEADWSAAPLNVRLGRLAADSEFAACDGGLLFLNSAFGWNPAVGQAAVDLDGTVAGLAQWPISSLAVRVRLGAEERGYVMVGAYDADLENPAVRDRHGLHFGSAPFATTAWIAEAGIKRPLAADAAPTALRAGAWSLDAPTIDLDGGGRARGARGWYVLAEQPLPDSPFAVFAHCGAARPSRSTLGFYFDVGVTATGLIPGRANDTCGIAFGAGRPSGPWREQTGARRESVLELTYSAALSDRLAIQPDLQWIRRPGALAGAAAPDDALVVGLRVVAGW